MFSDTDLEELLGWNDGTRVGIKSHALASVTVQCHEAIHGRIFNETTDGHLHRLCCMASGTALDQRHSGAYTDAAEIMFEDTRLAHEAAATYLSIQGHFHVLGKEGAAQVRIDTLDVIVSSGKIDLAEALAWAAENQAFLQAKWAELSGDGQ